MEASRNSASIDATSMALSSNDESSRVTEGKQYILHLAQFNNISLNPTQPFIQYKTKEECPPGRFPNRIYANYISDEKGKLTESLMALDLLRTYSNGSFRLNINIIDTFAEARTRPDTASTARDAAITFTDRILAGEFVAKKDFVILFCTNNPYIERQTLSAQRQVDQVLQKNGLAESGVRIKIEGVGFSRKQCLAVIHSELGALMAEKWKVAAEVIERSTGRKPKRSINDLLFQTRKKTITVPASSYDE